MSDAIRVCGDKMFERSSSAEVLPKSIPSILYQTWETHELSEGMAKARDTWLTANPDFQHILHDAEERRALVSEFGDKPLRAYDLLPHGAFKADLWRYCVLYKTGGVYADIDSLCLVPLNDYLRTEDRFVASAGMVRPGGALAWVVSNAMIAAVPGHPFLEKAISRATNLTLRGDLDGFFTTGPSGLGISINRVLGRRDKHPNPAGNYDHGFRLLRKVRSEIFEGERLVFSAQYEDYKEDLSRLGIAHWRSQERPLSLWQKVKRRFWN